MKVENITLSGKHVSLKPLQAEHLEGLAEAGGDDSIWELSVDRITCRADMARYIGLALDERMNGRALPFVTCLADTGNVIGSTRFGNIDQRNRKVEIGWTWIAPKFQRTAVNTEAKYLMLTHAFETWQCVRVEFKTDVLNIRSRNAILRLGATQEGVLRKHMITDQGRFRDSVYFSILDNEWESVKGDLKAKLSGRR